MTQRGRGPGRPAKLRDTLNITMRGELYAVLVAKRRAGDTWAEIAEYVSRKTGETVARSTLRRWYDEGRKASDGDLAASRPSVASGAVRLLE